jgi:hypothetical protein
MDFVIWYSIVILQPCVLMMYVSIYVACEIACISSLIVCNTRVFYMRNVLKLFMTISKLSFQTVYGNTENDYDLLNADWR